MSWVPFVVRPQPNPSAASDKHMPECPVGLLLLSGCGLERTFPQSLLYGGVCGCATLDSMKHT